MSPKAHLPDRIVLAITGDEATSFLDGLFTANIGALAEGAATHAALLTPQGKVLSAFFVWRTAEGVLIDALESDAAALTAKLKLYKLRAAVTLEERLDLSVLTGDGPPDPRDPALGGRMIAEDSADLPADDDYHRRRIEAGVPEFGFDYGPGEVFAMDVNLDRLGAVNYRKGCFVGQEVASRMFRKGEVRKRSWRVTAEAALTKGAALTAAGSTLGEVTSADGRIGIARLRIDRAQAAEGPFLADGAPVTLTPPGHLA